MNDRSEQKPADPSPVLGADAVRRIAELARLRVDDAEVPELVEHFGRMLHFVAHLEEADDPRLTPWELEPRAVEDLRPDEVRPPGSDGAPLSPEDWRRNAPETDGDYFTVPRVVG